MTRQKELRDEIRTLDLEIREKRAIVHSLERRPINLYEKRLRDEGYLRPAGLDHSVLVKGNADDGPEVATLSGVAAQRRAAEKQRLRLVRRRNLLGIEMAALGWTV